MGICFFSVGSPIFSPAAAGEAVVAPQPQLPQLSQQSLWWKRANSFFRQPSLQQLSQQELQLVQVVLQQEPQEEPQEPHEEPHEPQPLWKRPCLPQEPQLSQDLVQQVGWQQVGLQQVGWQQVGWQQLSQQSLWHSEWSLALMRSQRLGFSQQQLSHEPQHDPVAGAATGVAGAASPASQAVVINRNAAFTLNPPLGIYEGLRAAAALTGRELSSLGSPQARTFPTSSDRSTYQLPGPTRKCRCWAWG